VISNDEEEIIDKIEKIEDGSEYIINSQSTLSFSIDICVEIDQELTDPEAYYNNKFIYERVVKALKEISHSNEKYNYIRDLSIEFIEIGSLVLYSDILFKVEYVFDDDDTVLIHNEVNDEIKLVYKLELMPNDNACKKITNKDIQFIFSELISKFTINRDKDAIYDVFMSFSNYMKIDVKKIYKSLDDKTQKILVAALNKKI